MLRWVALKLIRFYQFFISPLLGQRCRFYPSCSHYSFECFSRFTFPRALWYSSRRLLKCSPWCDGGFDPPPGSNTVE